MQNKKNIGYDETKKMLNKLRTLNESYIKSKSLMEQEETSSEETDNNVDNVNGVDVKLISNDKMDLELTDTQKNDVSGLIDSFREQISQLAEFEPGFTFNENQIRLDGNIPNIDLSFVLIAGDEMGLYVNADMLKIEDETLEILDKLNKFLLTYEDALNPIIRERQNN